jgi:hypothetical protein
MLSGLLLILELLLNELKELTHWDVLVIALVRTHKPLEYFFKGFLPALLIGHVVAAE